MKRLGIVTLCLGLLLFVVGIGTSVWGGARAIDSVKSAVSDSTEMTGGTGSITLAEGDSASIFEETSDEQPSVTCTVQDPNGDSTSLRTEGNTSVSGNGASFVLVGNFTASQAGDHVATCDGGKTFLGPSLDFGAVGSGAVIAVGGIALIGLGALAMIIGAVLWFVGRSRAKSASSSDAPTGTYDTTPPPPAGTYDTTPPPPANTYGTDTTPPPPPSH